MRTEISHFWAGYFQQEADFFDFFEEDENGFDEDLPFNEQYISKFARSQNENWYDHDFFECGFEADQSLSTEEKLSDYSYSEQWLPEILDRISRLGITEINAFALISKEEIKNPVSLEHPGIQLIYLGEIEYEI